jgi:NAD(P)-dependent dehydrogenase (short-subunit alcohol dehydrogenase family)
MERLSGKVAVVIGGSSGIGRAVALRFAKEGAIVHNFDISASPREGGKPTNEVILGSGGSSYFSEVNILDESSVINAFNGLISKSNKLDITFIAAGMAEPMGDTREIKMSDFDLQVALNFRGTFLSIRESLKYMVPAKSGSIIPVSSNFGQVGVPNMTTYCGTKAAVIGMVKSVAVEMGKHNVRINALCPGATKTAINVKYRADQEIQEMWQRMTPLRMTGNEYIAEVEDIASAAAYLASDESRFMTGSTLTVDGGWTAH